MASIRGRYISLASSAARRSRLEGHLQTLGIAERYSWFPAICGDNNAAAARGLKTGEWGLWQSWIQLLKEELRQPDQSDWLHIVEDDVELSRHFWLFCQRLKPGIPKFDLLFTDMYVNPSIYRALSAQHQQLQAIGEIHLKNDLYSGCAASVLIHRKRLPEVLRRLETCSEIRKPLLPIDNQLRHYFAKNQLSFCRTAPFITGVSPDSIENSTIQDRNQQDHSVVITQKICSNLRRQLSIFNTGDLCIELMELFHQLTQKWEHARKANLTKRITLELMELAEQQGLLRYTVQPRLKGEPDNPQ